MKIQKFTSILFLSILLSFGSLAKLSSQVECWDPQKRNSNLSLQLYSGGDYILSNMSINETGTSPLLDQRDSTTTFIGAYKIGGLLKYQVSPKFYIKTGLEYKNIKERFDYREILSETPTVDAEGNPVTEITTRVYKTYNAFTSMDLPFLLGYMIKDGGLDLNIEAGISYNFSFNFKGRIVDNNLSLDENPQNYYINSTGVNFLTGIELGKRVSEKVRFFLNFQGKYNPSNIESSTNPIQQSLSTVGSAIGVEFKL